MSDQLEFSSYSFDGQEELCLRTGTKHSFQLTLIPPLFDEMNRMRSMLVDVMRLLDQRRIGSLLPDLPGTNESLVSLERTNLTTWKEAIADCASQFGGSDHVASFRGGGLIDDIAGAKRHWRLTPAKGSTMLRTMMRTRIVSDKEAGVVTTMAELAETAQSEPIILGGNSVGPALFADLQSASPDDVTDLRMARLESDSQPADTKLQGSALWLRAEPDADKVLSTAIANDLAAWVAR